MKSYLTLTNVQSPIMRGLVGIAALTFIMHRMRQWDNISLTMRRAASTWKK